MKKIEKYLTKPAVQRAVYLMVLLLWLMLNYNSGNFRKINVTDAYAGVPYWIVLLLPVLLLGMQLWWNNVWGWRLLCGLLMLFTLWMARLTITDIAAPVSMQPLIWRIGSIGFLLLLVLVLAFANWVLLHMKPRK